MCSIVNLHLLENLKAYAKQENNMYIGRATRDLQASKWANPYKVGTYNRERAVSLSTKVTYSVTRTSIDL